MIANAQERLVAIQSPFLVTLDSTSGVPLSSILIKHLAGVWGATFADGRLLSFDEVGVLWLPDHLVALNPASASHQVIGDIGFKIATGSITIERDPTSAKLFAVLDNKLYELNEATGSATLIAPLTGAVDGFTGFAIDHTGHAYVTGTAGPRLYELDLATGIVNKLKNFGLGSGAFYDLAFSRSGELWGSYEDYAASKSKTGLYLIDLANLTVTMKVKLQHAYVGLAFMPAPEEATYCTAKINSLGCVPALHEQGIPSAAANSGFLIWATDLVNQQIGALLWSVNGSASNPFHGGTLCVRGPLGLTPWASSGGAPLPTLDCSGELGVDFNTYAWNYNPNPALHVPGTTVWCQWYSRDPGFASPNDVSLSDALEFVLEP